MRLVRTYQTKETQAQVELVVDEVAREMIMFGVRGCLREKTAMFLADKPGSLPAPQYNPVNIVEK